MLIQFGLSGKLIAWLVMIGAFAIAVVSFLVAWKFSDFFIPPRYHWSKSGYAVLLIKLGIACSAAFWSFIILTGFLDSIV